MRSIYYHDVGVIKSNIHKVLAVGAILALAVAMSLGRSSSAAPTANYSLFGEAILVSPGNASPTAAQMVSDATPGFGGVKFNDPAGLTVADVQTLAADFNVTDDDCAGGSPRFQVKVDTGAGEKNLFVYLGPAPSYTACAPGWQSSGNLADDTDFVDATQLGGTFYDTWANVRAIYGTFDVLGVSLVTDAGWSQADGEQTVQVDNVKVNDALYTFEGKDSCKKGGWQQFTSDPGPFKNQGDCVSHFAQEQH